MNIDNFTDTIKACRFCFMCRHLSGVGNVTFREADTPRIRAAFIDGITRDKSLLSNADFIEAVYSSDMSAACRFHCVKHYDENGLMLAFRRDIVEAGFAPDDVKALAEELIKASGAPKISGRGDVLYLETADLPSEAKAFAKIMKSAGVKYAVAENCLAGKELLTLGYFDAAKKAMSDFADAVKASGAKIIAVSDTALYDSLANDSRALGVKISPKVMHSSEYILSLKLKYSKAAGRLYYLESDYLKNYCQSCAFPKELLKKLKAELVEFGTNNEESYTCAEGAVVLEKLRPAIVKKMAEYIRERADDAAKDKFAVASPYTAAMLSKHCALKVSTLTEIAASCL